MLDPNRYELNAATVGFRKRMRQEVSMEAFEMALQQQTDTIKVRREEKETPISEIHVMGAQRFGLGGNEKTKTAERQWRQVHGYPLRSFKADGGPIVLPVKRVDSALATPMNVGLTQYLKYNATVGEYVSRITEPVLDHITSENPMIKQARVTGLESSYEESMANLRQWNEKRSNQYQNAMARAMAPTFSTRLSAPGKPSKAGYLNRQGQMVTASAPGKPSKAGYVKQQGQMALASNFFKSREFREAIADAKAKGIPRPAADLGVDDFIAYYKKRGIEIERPEEETVVSDPEVNDPYSTLNLPMNATPAQIGAAYASRSGEKSFDLMTSLEETFAIAQAYDAKNYTPVKSSSFTPTEDEINDLFDYQPSPPSVPGSLLKEIQSGTPLKSSQSAMVNAAFTPAMEASERLSVNSNLTGSSVRPFGTVQRANLGTPVSLIEPAARNSVGTAFNGSALSVTDMARQGRRASLDSLRRVSPSFDEQLQQQGNVPTENLATVTPEKAGGSVFSSILGRFGFSAPTLPAAQVAPTPLAGNSVVSFNSAEGRTDIESPASGSTLYQQSLRSKSGSGSRVPRRPGRIYSSEGIEGQRLNLQSPLRPFPPSNKVGNLGGIIN